MYYITLTIKDWIPLVARQEFRDIVIKSFKFLIDESRIKLHGYVIISNHIHCERLFVKRAWYLGDRKRVAIISVEK